MKILKNIYLFIALLFLNFPCIAEQDITGNWETIDQYGYGYMTIKSMNKGKITFYSSFWNKDHIEIDLTDFNKTEDGFDLKMELRTSESTTVEGKATYQDELLCLKVSNPDEPNLMCFVRPEKLNELRQKATNN